MPEPASAFSKVEFLVSAGITGGLPPEDLPELAFAGRSNVGKSSAINALAGRKRLAFVSQDAGPHADHQFLRPRRPRHGWSTCRATAMRACRRRCARSGTNWSAATSARAAPGGRGGADGCAPSVYRARRAPARMAAARRRSALLVLLSKADKLSRQERAKVACAKPARASRAARTTPRCGCSRACRGEGVEETRALLEAWLRAASDGNKKPPVKGNKPGAKTP